MLDIKFIRENKQKFNEIIINKGVDLNIDHLLDLDQKRKTLKSEVDELREKRNQITEQIKNGKKTDELIKNAKEIKTLLVDLEEKFRNVKKEFESLMFYVPNVYSDDTPIGKNESENVVRKEFGERTKFTFTPKDHIELGKNLDLLDLERGAKVSGFRGYFLKNEAVLLHLGILLFALQKLQDEGFTLMVTPTLSKDFALYGTGWFPFDMDNIYKAVPAGKLKLDSVKEEGTNLVGTAEVPLCAYHAEEQLEEKDLPILLCGFSQCYRSEVGSYGRDTKGIYRIREFSKVEQVVICRNDVGESERWHQKLIKISQGILNELELPHRLVQMCTGDMGAGKYKMYDIETWMPLRKDYGETHSASNMTDWQSRRLNIRYKTKDGTKKYVHMLNNTAIASPRILIAILENYQRKDGAVEVPKVLQKWVGKKIIKPKK